MKLRSVHALGLVALAALSLLGAPDPVSAAETRPEAGAMAPGAGWVCADGGTARTGRSDAEFIEREPVIAWRQPLHGTVAEDPVTWDEWIFVSMPSTKPGARLLQMHSVADGKVAARREYKTSGPLQMSISAGILVLRSGPSKISALRCNNGQLFDIWNVDLPESADSVVALGREVYVRGPNSITRWQVGSKTPIWTQPGIFRGRLAIRGACVYSVIYDEPGNASLIGLDRPSGKRASLSSLGHHDGKIVGSEALEPIVVLPESVFVYHDLGVPAKGGRQYHQTSTDRKPDGADPYPMSGLVDVSPGILETRDGHIYPGHARDPVAAHRKGSNDGIVLATKNDDPQFLTGWELATSVDGGVYHPSGALRLSDLQICWRFPEPIVRRPVPCGRTLVAVVGRTELIALREPETPTAAGAAGATGATGDRSPASPPAVAGAAPVEGRVVLRSGEIRTGPVTVAADAISVGAAGAAVKLRPASVLVAAANDGRVLFSANVADLRDGFEALAASRAATAMGALLQSAVRLADPEFLQSFLNLGIERDAPQADIDRLDARIKDLLRPGKVTKADPAAAEDLRKKAEALTVEQNAAVLTQYRTALPSLTGALRIDVIREILRADPADKDAGAALRALLPPDVQPPDVQPPNVQPPAVPKIAAEWADLAATASHTAIRVLKPKPPNAPDLTRADRALGLASVTWRKDLIAIQSDRILVIAPADRPGPIARCIELGETVCTVLESLFAGGKARRDTREPLTIFVYSSKDEYVAEVKKAGETPPHGVEATAGFYSPRYELARLYIPEGDAEFSDLVPTFAHELTHQWIALRCPLFRDGEDRMTVTTPGYWIVEGFATFVEELEISPRTRTYRAPRTTDSTSVVALSPLTGLHSWRDLFAMPQAGFAKINRNSEVKVKFPNRLGWHRNVNSVRMFYSQSAAACAALWSMDDGAWRAKFINYVGQFYRGEEVTIEQAFGISADELGRKVDAWCGRK